jgi:hypothetical protein
MKRFISDLSTSQLFTPGIQPYEKDYLSFSWISNLLTTNLPTTKPAAEHERAGPRMTDLKAL